MIHVRLATILDAPRHYSAEHASAWAAGFNTAHRLFNYASDELRSEGASDGATAAGSAEEVRPQGPEESRHGQAEGGGAPETKERGEAEGRDGEEGASEVSGDGSSVLDGRE